MWKQVCSTQHHSIMAENSGCLPSELLIPKLLKRLFISNGVIQIIKDITCLQGFYYWQVWSSVHCTFWNLIYQTEIQLSNWEGSDHKFGEYLECQSQIFFSASVLLYVICKNKWNQYLFLCLCFVFLFLTQRSRLQKGIWKGWRLCVSLDMTLVYKNYQRINSKI